MLGYQINYVRLDCIFGVALILIPRLVFFFFCIISKIVLFSSIILEASNQDCERPPLKQECKRLQITAHDAYSRYLTFGIMFFIMKFAFKIKEYVDELSFYRFSINGVRLQLFDGYKNDLNEMMGSHLMSSLVISPVSISHSSRLQCEFE